MMFFATLKMMLLVLLAMMRCLPLCARRHASFALAFIIRRSQHHLPKANIIQKNAHLSVDKCAFFVGTPEGIRIPDLSLRRRPLYPAELQAHIYTALYPKKVFLSTKTGDFFIGARIYYQESIWIGRCERIMNNDTVVDFEDLLYDEDGGKPSER